MNHFTAVATERLAIFTPYLNQSITLHSPLFKVKQGKVSLFVAEIQHTIEQLSKQQEAVYTECYAQRLILQFDTLQKAVKALNISPTMQRHFQSSFHFPKNIHNLPVEKRRVEYHKALRALNEKISWLVEQHYLSDNAVEKAKFLTQIQETEYRKMKCLAAIEALS